MNYENSKGKDWIPSILLANQQLINKQNKEL